jgi:hypothetical protein
MSELVNKLSQGDHPVQISMRTQPTLKGLKERIDRGFVHVKFPETRGGTELGLTLQKEETNLNGADFETGKGSIFLVGRLKLDYVPVKCLVTIDLATMAGQGRLVVIQEPPVPAA